MTDELSPCIKICALDQTGVFCVGCGRSLDEIAIWSSANEQERRVILEQLPERLKQLQS